MRDRCGGHRLSRSDRLWSLYCFELLGCGILPYTGAAVGGGFNAYFTSKVCDAAYYLYRERFLALKYGEQFIAVPTAPAGDLDPHYPEEDEQFPPAPLLTRVERDSS